MLNVIIEEGLHDEEFIEKWCHGFDLLAERVKDYTPEWAEPITWCKAAQIRKAARLYAEVKPSMLEWGCAIEHTPACFQTVRALLCLPSITGNIDQPGSWSFGMTPLPPFPQLFDKMPMEQQRKRLGFDDYKVLSGELAQLPSAHIPTIFNAIRTGEPYPIRTGFIFGNNALSTYGDVKLVYETLMALDYLVVAELYMTPTAELADLVLPVATSCTILRPECHSRPAENLSIFRMYPRRRNNDRNMSPSGYGVWPRKSARGLRHNASQQSWFWLGRIEGNGLLSAGIQMEKI